MNENQIDIFKHLSNLYRMINVCQEETRSLQKQLNEERSSSVKYFEDLETDREELVEISKDISRHNVSEKITPNVPVQMVTAGEGDHGVYFIITEPFMNRIKIGKTKNIGKRIGQLQTGCPFLLKVWKFLEVKSKEKMDNLESKFHQLFRSRRRQGEWFEMSLQELDEFVPNGITDVEILNKLVSHRVIKKWFIDVSPNLSISAEIHYENFVKTDPIASLSIDLFMKEFEEVKKFYQLGLLKTPSCETENENGTDTIQTMYEELLMETPSVIKSTDVKPAEQTETEPIITTVKNFNKSYVD